MTEEEFYTEQDEVLKQLAYRREHFDEIAEKVDAFILGKYGITEFVKRFYNFLGEGEDYKKPEFKSGIFLARAIPSFSLEDLFVDSFSKKLGLTHRAMPLSCDGLSGSSEDKFSKINLTELNNRDCYVSLIEGTKISSSYPVFVLQTGSGEYLLDWHVRRREILFSLPRSKDLSMFLMKLSGVADYKPEYIHLYSEKENKMKKGLYSDDLLSLTTKFRPCVSWWYPIFLSLFLLDNVLYDDYSKQITNIEDPFSKMVFSSFREVERSTGLKPLVLKEMFPDSVSFSYIGESLHSFDEFKLHYEGFLSQVILPSGQISHNSFFKDVENYFTF